MIKTLGCLLLSSAIVSLLAGCASTTPAKIYVPTPDSETMSFYRNGVPIGSVNSDSSLIMISLEPSELAHTIYMRLWFLYKNNSNSPYLLEPLKAVTLSIQGEKKSYDDISPESPTKILAHIENEEAASMILQAIGGTLKSMSARPTTIKNRQGEEWEVNDKSAKAEAIMNRTASSMTNTAIMYDVFKNSVNSGILRRNTIFHGESIHGYIYFPLPKVNRGFGNQVSMDPTKYKYKLLIMTQFGEKIIEFTPAEGE